jgi:hypothetical protein
MNTLLGVHVALLLIIQKLGNLNIEMRKDLLQWNFPCRLHNFDQDHPTFFNILNSRLQNVLQLEKIYTGKDLLSLKWHSIYSSWLLFHFTPFFNFISFKVWTIALSFIVSVSLSPFHSLYLLEWGRDKWGIFWSIFRSFGF